MDKAQIDQIVGLQNILQDKSSSMMVEKLSHMITLIEKNIKLINLNTEILEMTLSKDNRSHKTIDAILQQGIKGNELILNGMQFNIEVVQELENYTHTLTPKSE